MNTCPCCSHVLLRHIRSHEVYWFCRNCWQEMPEMSVKKMNLESIITGISSSRLRKKQMPSQVFSTI
jgi:hypothetical protein